MTQRTSTRLAASAVVFALLVLAAAGTHSLDQMVLMLEWVREAGPVGWFVFGLLYLVCTLLMLPASFLQGSAGFLLGPIAGFGVASAASVCSGLVAFALGRTVLRGPVARRVARDPRFTAIDHAIGDGGTYLVALLRLSPLSPFNVFNYALGLTRVRPRDFALGTWLGSIPAIFLYSWIGSTVGSLADLATGNASGDTTVQVVVLVCTVIASLLVARFAQQALKRALAPVPA